VANSIDGLLKFLEANNIAYVITYSHTEVILSLLCAFFWVFPVRLHFIFRRFGKLCLFRGHRRGGMKNLHNYPPMKMEQTVPKRWRIKLRRRVIAQKKAYNIQNKAKV
jgi:hypothetical protein